uniref:Lipid phosphate phosphatase-related protein type 5-like n=1 Tax=Callorhinchus milii TaxID=7868 RepID=A0A4W3GM87_CALMI
MVGTVLLAYHFEYTDTFQVHTQGFFCFDSSYMKPYPGPEEISAVPPVLVYSLVSALPMVMMVLGELAAFVFQVDFVRQERTILTADCCSLNPLLRRVVRFLGQPDICPSTPSPSPPHPRPVLPCFAAPCSLSLSLCSATDSRRETQREGRRERRNRNPCLKHVIAAFGQATRITFTLRLSRREDISRRWTVRGLHPWDCGMEFQRAEAERMAGRGVRSRLEPAEQREGGRAVGWGGVGVPNRSVWGGGLAGHRNGE